MQTVYLDHAATTPLDDRILEEMVPFLKERFGNASSVHAMGRKARFAVEESRERIADVLGAAPGEIVFTSGGTEADNLALTGVANALPDDRKRIVTSAVEHKAVLEPVKTLERAGHPVRVLSTSASGVVEVDQLEEVLSNEVGLVSLMHVNNEIGAVTPIAEISDICRERGILLHSDAVQSAGYFPVDVEELGVDLLTISGHKLYGPKGVGILYVRGGTDLDPLIRGGGQERERRGGTENVPAVVGMARAIELAAEERNERRTHVENLRMRLLTQLEEALAGDFICTSPTDPGEGAPHIVNVAFSPGEGQRIDGEMLLLNLDTKGICVSNGSACTSGAVEPSHVLQAMGLEEAAASAAVRFSLGKDNTRDEIDFAVETLAGIVRRMRK